MSLKIRFMSSSFDCGFVDLSSNTLSQFYKKLKKHSLSENSPHLHLFTPEKKHLSTAEGKEMAEDNKVDTMECVMNAVGGDHQVNTPKRTSVFDFMDSTFGNRGAVPKKSSGRPSSASVRSRRDQEESDESAGMIEYKYVISWFCPLEANRESFDKFVGIADRAFIHICRGDRIKLLHFVRNQCEGIGLSFRSLPCNTWDDIKQALMEFLQIRDTEEEVRLEMYRMERGPGEDMFRFYLRLVGKVSSYMDVVKREFASSRHEIISREKMANDFIRNLFIRSLDSPHDSMIKDKRPADITEAYRMFKELRTGLKDGIGENNKFEELKDMINNLALLNGSRNNNNRNFVNPEVHMNEVVEITCQLCDKPGHDAKSCDE